MQQLVRQPGELDQRITLSHRVLTPDGMGGATSSLSAYASNIWAKVEPKSGNEEVANGRTEEIRRYDIFLRARTDIVPTDVLTWNGRQMNITAILDPGPRHLYMQLEAELGARL